jgi:hypothetical protein
MGLVQLESFLRSGHAAERIRTGESALRTRTLGFIIFASPANERTSVSIGAEQGDRYDHATGGGNFNMQYRLTPPN